MHKELVRFYKYGTLGSNLANREELSAPTLLSALSSHCRMRMPTAGTAQAEPVADATANGGHRQGASQLPTHTSHREHLLVIWSGPKSASVQVALVWLLERVWGPQSILRIRPQAASPLLTEAL